MIVNQAEYGWDIIFQRAHAILAAQIAMYWKVETRPEPWTELIAAIADHDDGQRDWEGDNHLTDAGAPLNFMLQPPDIAQAKQMVDNARYRSRWIALLTSMHTTALYESWRGTDKKLDTFLDEQQNYQRKLARGLDVPIQQARDTYQLMYFSDALSLVLCKDQIPPDGLHLEVTPLPSGEMAKIYAVENNLFGLQPWPWEDEGVTLSVEVYHLNQLAFKNDQELYKALKTADVSVKKWCFRAS
ncbi:DUF3891 family protein [Tunicatimonas pelagia]|uniref:DUF3891 family protein n=1 Tax=Tunicatimonas pelagia TaxID=931531 RepID=UPI002665B7BE|nr:DUF3891 family protein [Tunicatimonas pelagia]WKN46285.1 DUF3891 family protein [Tunicatimonas pelagia]